MQPGAWKAIGNVVTEVWAVVGPLVGIAVGAWLTTLRQKREWVADNKKEEYRELLAAISQALSVHLHWNSQFVHGPDDQRQLSQVTPNLVAVIRSRLFIAKEIERLNVLRRWFDISHDFENGHDEAAFGSGIKQLLDDIQIAALKDVSGD